MSTIFIQLQSKQIFLYHRIFIEKFSSYPDSSHRDGEHHMYKIICSEFHHFHKCVNSVYHSMGSLGPSYSVSSNFLDRGASQHHHSTCDAFYIVTESHNPLRIMTRIASQTRDNRWTYSSR